MFPKILLLGYLVFATSLAAQELPAETALPVMLDSAIDAAKTTPGAMIRARLMQDVNLPSGVRIRAGATVVGSVIEVHTPAKGSGSQIAFKFDRLISDKHTLHFSSHLRALASKNEVFEAQLPTNAIDDYGTSIADWNTVQVGGDEVVYRGDGPVMRANEVVGSADSGGAVEAKLQTVPSDGCHASVEPQSLWVFATTACGVYGYFDTTIAHRGRTDPVGQIVLASESKLRVQGGSALLLITN
jgi:hypothetical protein